MLPSRDAVDEFGIFRTPLMESELCRFSRREDKFPVCRGVLTPLQTRKRIEFAIPSLFMWWDLNISFSAALIFPFRQEHVCCFPFFLRPPPRELLQLDHFIANNSFQLDSLTWGNYWRFYRVVFEEDHPRIWPAAIYPGTYNKLLTLLRLKYSRIAVLLLPLA